LGAAPWLAMKVMLEVLHPPCNQEGLLQQLCRMQQWNGWHPCTSPCRALPGHETDMHWWDKLPQSSHFTAAGCSPPQGHAPEDAPALAARTSVLNSWCSSRVVLPWAAFTGSCSNSKDCSTGTTTTTQQYEANNGTLRPRPQRYTRALAISPLGGAGMLPPKHKWMQPIFSHHATINSKSMYPDDACDTQAER